MQKPTLILASVSIGRKALLEKLGVPFTVMPSNIDEETITNPDPYKMLIYRARAKAENVIKRLGTRGLASSKMGTRRYTLDANYLVIAADSMAILDGETFGKARDRADAKRIVTALMGKTHEFVTATAIVHLSSNKTIQQYNNISKTYVTTRHLDPDSLTLYLSRYDFSRFAAGYALNETPWDWVTKIKGSYTNVIGLPFEVLLPILRNLKRI